MLNELPKDPMILLSVINTKLRDQYSSLQELCEDLNLEQIKLEKQLETIDYIYDKNRNQFL